MEERDRAGASCALAPAARTSASISRRSRPSPRLVARGRTILRARAGAPWRGCSLRFSGGGRRRARPASRPRAWTAGLPVIDQTSEMYRSDLLRWFNGRLPLRQRSIENLVYTLTELLQAHRPLPAPSSTGASMSCSRAPFRADARRWSEDDAHGRSVEPAEVAGRMATSSLRCRLTCTESARNCVMDTTDSKITFDERASAIIAQTFYKKILPNWHTDATGRAGARQARRRDQSGRARARTSTASSA